MNSPDILAKNHDIHMHSQDFSDGCHPIRDVIRHAARWQDPPCWAGLSDHSPQEDKQIKLYIHQLQGFQQELLTLDGIQLLAGIELEWNPEGLASDKLALDGLDYVLAAYHGNNFSTAGQAERYFEIVTRHPYSDVIAHPDRFLGNVDTLSIGWKKVFDDFSSRKVLCEYNLTTPLRPEVLDIAINQTEVNFVIGSDTHDFRNIAERRIIDAWSEMLGGGYALACEYLASLLKMACTPKQTESLSRLFETRQLLGDLQNKIYQRSLNSVKKAVKLLPEEELFLYILEGIPECAVDKDFLIRRLDRFSSLSPARIVSLLNAREFKDAVDLGRQKRQTRDPLN